MLATLSLATVLLAGLYFVALAAVSFLAPSRAADFLGGFAQTAGRHYLELGLRIITGVALSSRVRGCRFRRPSPRSDGCSW